LLSLGVSAVVVLEDDVKRGEVVSKCAVAGVFLVSGVLVAFSQFVLFVDALGKVIS
jgi:hypothetical protein